MNQPVIDMESENKDTDTTGKKWSQALVDQRGRIMAGYDEAGTFQCYVDNETLFAGAMITIQSIIDTKDQT